MRRYKPLVLLILLSEAILLLTTCSHTHTLSQAATGQSRNQPASMPETDAVEIVIWVEGNPEGHWRLDGPLKAADRVKIKASGVYYPVDSNDEEEFVAAAQAGHAPDIIEGGPDEFRVWVAAGYLAPFDSCRSTYPEFNDVIDSLWQPVTWHGRVWGVPFEAGPAPLFFNKAKLKEMGWSEAEVAALPDKIKRGEFIQDDLLATAKLAIAKGVVAPGFGYWYRPSMNSYLIHPYLAYGGRMYDPARDKLVIEMEPLVEWYTFQRQLVTEGVTPDHLYDSTWQVGATGRGIYHDTVAHGRVLFWSGKISFWHGWAKQYAVNLGGDTYLYDFVGYALYPSAIKGQPGFTDTAVNFYAITSPRASGREHQNAACALLAKAMTPEINSLNTTTSMTLGVLKSQVRDANYSQHPLLIETRYMLDYARYYPHPLFNLYRDTLLKFMLQAENGDLPPGEAAAAAIDQLQHQLGEAIIIE